SGYRVATCLLMQDKHVECISRYETFLIAAKSEVDKSERLRELSVAAYNNRGNAYYATKHYTQAANDYRQAIRLLVTPQPLNIKQLEVAVILANRAHTYYQLKMQPEGDADTAEVSRILGTLEKPDTERADVAELVAWAQSISQGKRNPHSIEGLTPAQRSTCF